MLGVDADATAKEITKAYRKLARELHPDQNPGDAAAEERFKEVSAAYDVLGDEAKRKEYDEVRRWARCRAWVPRTVAAAPAASPSTSATWAVRRHRRPARSDVRPRRPGARPAGRGAGVGPRRGADLTAQLDARLRRRRPRHHHHAVPHQRRAVLDLSRVRAPSPARRPSVCRRLRRPRRGRRQPGHVLVLVAVPCLRQGSGVGHHRSVPDLSRHRRRAAPTRGQDPHPRRRDGRPDDPAQGPWRARAATAGPPATCSSRSRCTPHDGSVAAATTSP